VQTFLSGEIHEGEWTNDLKHGEFTVTKPDGKKITQKYEWNLLVEESGQKIE